MSGRRLSPAYTEFVRAVSRALYDFDPDGIGSSIDAPIDEYDDLALRLASELVMAVSASDVGRIARGLFASAEEPLIVALWAALELYKSNPGPDA